MQKTFNLCIDRQSEIFEVLQSWADETFYMFDTVEIHPNTVYVIGRQQLMDNMPKIRLMCENPSVRVIFNNSAEGAWTIESQLRQLKIEDLVRDGRLLLIAGAETDIDLPCLTYEHFLFRMLAFDETRQAQSQTPDIFNRKSKPFKFLFLNGRARPHRKYLYERLQRLGLLEHALWTMLEAKPCVVRHFRLEQDGVNLMATPTPLKRLPDRYEVPRYRDPVFGPILADRSFIKQELFRHEWGEIYLHATPYIDTYFSLVTETICAESTRSFRTEKIAKVLAMGHPFVVASTPGFYRDLRNLGFRTFNQLIDESFDKIDHAQSRMDRLIDTVADLCQQDLVSFLDQAQDICIHNQLHLDQFVTQHNRDFPERFFQFLKNHARS